MAGGKTLEPNVPKYVEAIISFVRTVKYERAIFAGRLKVLQTDRVPVLLSVIPLFLIVPMNKVTQNSAD